MARLKNKVAIITGAGSGIGRATALLLAEHGAKVAVADIDEETGATVCREINAAGGDAFFHATDVSDAAAANELVRATVERWGGCHVLHNNAFWAQTGITVIDTPEDVWDRTLDVTLKSIFLMSREVLPFMVEAGGGSIINMASTAGIVGSRSFSAYAAAKGGVISLTKSMATDFGKQGVRVNCISPGVVRTAATADLQNNPAWVERQKRRLLLNDFGEPRQIAYGVLFLASDESAYVTGSNLVMDGGATSQ